MKDTERLIQQLSKVDPKVKIFDNFGHSHPLKSLQRNYFYFSDIQSTLENPLVHFSKKFKPKIFYQNH